MNEYVKVILMFLWVSAAFAAETCELYKVTCCRWQRLVIWPACNKRHVAAAISDFMEQQQSLALQHICCTAKCLLRGRNKAWKLEHDATVVGHRVAAITCTQGEIDVWGLYKHGRVRICTCMYMPLCVHVCMCTRTSCSDANRAHKSNKVCTNALHAHAIKVFLIHTSIKRDLETRLKV